MTHEMRYSCYVLFDFTLSWIRNLIQLGYHCSLSLVHFYVRLRDNAIYPDSKARGTNIGPIWVLSPPNGTHVGPRNLAIRVYKDLSAGGASHNLLWDVITYPWITAPGSKVHICYLKLDVSLIQYVCKLGMMEWDSIYSSLFLTLVHGFMRETSDILLYNNLLMYQVLCTVIYIKIILYSFR